MPRKRSKLRNTCLDFCYFERECEVYSGEEGIEKGINGYILGDGAPVTKFKRTWNERLVKA